MNIAEVSKSQYMYGKQCQLRLWYYRHRKDLRPENDQATRGIFNQGHLVGELAKKYFRGGVEVKAEYFDHATANKQTLDFVAKGKSVIFEAYACSNDGMYSRIDILKKVRGQQQWDLIEVKSSTSVKDQFIEDMAVQRYAFEGAGFNIRKSQLMYINNKFVRKGEINVKELFKIKDMTEMVIERMPTIKENLVSFIATIKSESEPAIAPGPHCNKPYACPFIYHCGKDQEKEDFGDNELVVDQGILNQFIEQLQYPLFFLDYETINTAVPPFDGMRPYKQYTFQYSLHIQRHRDGPVEHREFIHDQASEPREALVKQLVQDCEEMGSVVVYSMSFEAGRNRELAHDFPAYQSQLLAINRRMVDLAIPFKHKGLWRPAWGRQYSIKITLPALVPELSYKQLAIQGGGAASIIYLDILYDLVSGQAKEQILADLRAYCGLDTYAMVKLLQVIYSKIEHIVIV